MTWWYLVCREYHETIFHGTPERQGFISKQTLRDDLVICSDPKNNPKYWEPTITHPLLWIKDCRERYGEEKGDGYHIYKDVEVIFWSEIPEDVALEFKKTFMSDEI